MLIEGKQHYNMMIKRREAFTLAAFHEGLRRYTPADFAPQTDEGKIRAMAILNKVPIVTTITGAYAAAKAIVAMQKREWGVKPLQAYFA